MNLNLQRGVLNDPTASFNLFSTSQGFDVVPNDKSADGAFPICIKNAPLFAYQKEGRRYGVTQGCCNSWNCPRCGIMRAKHEYGRMIEGCRTLAKEHQLWFITVTCRGREMTKNEADNGYGKWTNKLFTRWRDDATRKGKAWHYVQVTERQKRGHPHSHILTTWAPSDMRNGTRWTWRTSPEGNRNYVEVEKIFSDYVGRSVVGVGLGNEYDISRVESSEAASRYVAKYLFKDSIFTAIWPENWRRVRYSQQFPKLPDRESNAFVLLKREDWARLATEADVIITTSDETKNTVWNAVGWANVTIK